VTEAPSLSLEFFPPKTPALEASLWRAVERLAPLGPRFVSVTYGAGGTTRERTHATVTRLRCETALEPAAHLTCVGASRAEVDAVARGYWQSGIRHVVALRGDPPAGTGAYQPHPEGYAGAADLVAGLRRVGDFEISVAAYPETHPEAASPEADLDALKKKLDAGAARAITQFFFDADAFFRFRDRARMRGITIPIVPGILPIGSLAQVTRFAAQCGASIPAAVAARFEGLEEDAAGRAHAAVEVASALCRRLASGGADAFHFYTLNRAELVLAIAGEIGLRAPAAAESD
jgi:methylenetetrahydrofolate reductase (NADH)